LTTTFSNFTNNNSKNINFNVNKNITTHNLDKYSNNQNIKEIKLKFGKDGSEFVFQYSRVLKIYYLTFKKSGVMRKRFKVNFIVDGTTIIDPRFEVDNDNSGHFYNLIESSMFRKRVQKSLFCSKNVNHHSSKQNNKKFWENIFEIKQISQRESSSVSDLSEVTEGAIEKLLNNNVNLKNTGEQHKKSKKNLKSILKRGNINDQALEETNSNNSDKENNQNSQNTPKGKICKTPPNKKVSFNDTIHYSY
jgi:hypothetical protein